DVEYQGDGNKAIFYYIADGRVDFRQLIKVLAEAFRVRIEMKQIGARQEAGRIGGFGPCGRELCCASWMKSFVSVNTGAARFQDLSLNPQKLAGQCAKLKCCMNYEVDQYVEAGRKLPSREMVLQTQDAEFYLFKADILSGMVTYSSDRRLAANLTTITAERAMAIIAMNKEGEKPASLQAEGVVQESGVVDLATQDDMSRFDKKKKKKKNKSKGENRQAASSVDSAQNEKETPSAEEHPNTAQPRRQKGQRNGNRKDGDRKPRRDRKDNTSQNDKPQETGQA
ncbi:MAG: regulatory iron-sulfur-containing complex subunit RicT, partial [Bacteroidaceae bacterium]|nr:regulatory iron-sulfur-containing complex subunit RicT [Bacteroidaceae bacterium]